MSPVEFDCRDCGLHIIALGLTEPPPARLCAHCLWFPGWVYVEELRRIIDPDGWARPNAFLLPPPKPDRRPTQDTPAPSVERGL